MSVDVPAPRVLGGTMIQVDEAERLRTLDEYQILDTPPEQAMEEAVRLAAHVCGTETGALGLVDREREWFKAVHGILPSELPRKETFCELVFLGGDFVFEVPDASQDARFRDLAIVSGSPEFRFYAGVPLRAGNGLPLGVLCVLDRQPRHLSPAQRSGLRMVANQISVLLELRLSLLQTRERESIARDRLEALRALEHRREDLTSMLVHDLKSPITAILAAGQFTQRTASDPEIEEAAREVLSAGETLHRMVLDILDVAKAAEGSLIQHEETLDLHDLAEDVALEMGPMGKERGQSIRVESTLSTATLRGERPLLRRVLMNLVDNALKYGPPNEEVRISIAEEQSTPDALRLDVCDDGPSIPEAYRPLIFEKFFQAEGVPRSRPSHGLGLTLCRLAVEAHGGRIWVESTADHGNCFAVTLPRRMAIPRSASL